MPTFNEQKNAIIFIHNNRIEFHLPHVSEPLTIPITNKEIDNMEVSSTQAIEKHITDELTRKNIQHYNAVAVLTEEITFLKTLTPEEMKNSKDSVSNFISEIPFDPNYVAHIETKSKEGAIVIIATYIPLYMSIIQPLEKLDWRISGILPIHLFNNQKPSIALINSLFSQKEEIWKTVQFPKKKVSIEDGHPLQKLETPPESDNVEENKTKEDPKEDVPKKNNNLVKTIMDRKVIIAIVVVLILVVAGAAWFFLKGGPEESDSVEPSETEATFEESVPEPEEEVPIEEEEEEGPSDEEVLEAAKEDLSLQVQNGTTITGLAGKTGDLLQEEGYQNIETGNAEEQDYTEIVIGSREEVPEIVIEDLNKILSDAYEAPISEETLETDTSDYDIIIIVGDSSN